MKGLYLYCIRFCLKENSAGGKEETDSEFFTPGIDGNRIWTLTYQDLEAVVSEVSLEKFDSAETKKKAQEDLKWIKEKAELHEKAIEQAMKIGERVVSVIPMKFGTIFKTKEKLEKTLKEYYSKFKQSLENLAGKQEWGVKVYLNQRSFNEKIKKASLVVEEKEKEIAQLPEGLAYFLQKEVEAAVSKEADKALQKYVENFFETLKRCAKTGTKGKILKKELTGKSLPMILNAVFLVSEEKLEDFIKEIGKLKEKHKSQGFTFEYSGPWPPYNFI